MEIQISQSKNPEDYEILIRRRGEADYAAYCPQLNEMITGVEHEEVESAMRAKVLEHISKLEQ
ncbi:MAG: hypothetical protein ACM3U1_11925 [Chloroflexota bacterium]